LDGSLHPSTLFEISTIHFLLSNSNFTSLT
jgi:hypothetical protein